MAKLFIVRGVSGSGKSTYAKSLGLPHFEADMYHMVNGIYNWQAVNVKRAHEWCRSVVCDSLSQGLDTVVSNTFLEYWEIKPYVDYCRANDCEVIITTMNGNYSNVHGVDSVTLAKQHSRMVAHDVILQKMTSDYGLYTKRESTTYPGLFVLKYKREVFYDSLWNDKLIEMRGRVVDSDGITVINPLTKVFNRNERGTDMPLDTQVIAIDKINGFMGCLTKVGDKIIPSTTGSLDSDFCGYIRYFLNEYILNEVFNHDGFTFVMEVVHPSDPHIIPEREGLYLLAMRHVADVAPYTTTVANEVLLDNIAKRMGVLRPAWRVTDFGSIVNDVKSVTHEGYMVYGNGIALKLKSPHYLITKLLARVKADKFAKITKRDVPEEYYEFIDYIRGYNGFSGLDEQARLTVMRDYFNNQ